MSARTTRTENEVAQPQGSSSPVVDTPGAAVYTKTSEAFLKKARREGRGPAYVRIGRKLVRYRLADLDRYLESNLQ